MNLAKQWYSTMRQNWQEARAEETFSKYFWGNFLVCFAVYMLIVQWLKYNSTRHGRIINDPLYDMLPLHDFSNTIFFFTYSATIVSLIYLIAHPQLLHRAFTTFVVIFVIRAICIFLVPLSPSGDMLPLHDPFTNFMANEEEIRNDLFFSGHVSDLAFFFFVVRAPWLRRYILLCAIAVGSLLILQRVHYTMDVIAAPIFAYFCYWLCIEKDLIWSPFLKKSADEKTAHQPATE
ncbi:MAG: hypothetical protein JWO03_729 [Bacteroidetes bacterium]|nr:hypothetical protein [Bacteroidota bacterium]